MLRLFHWVSQYNGTKHWGVMLFTLLKVLSVSTAWLVPFLGRNGLRPMILSLRRFQHLERIAHNTEKRAIVHRGTAGSEESPVGIGKACRAGYRQTFIALFIKPCIVQCVATRICDT